MKHLTSLSILLLFIVACTGDAAAPEIAVWSTKCNACDERIEDLSLAATARSSDGTVQAFDKASCLIRTIPEGEEWEVWFHDHDSENWIKAEDATFVIQRTSAGGSITQVPAFPNDEAARAYYERTQGRNELVPNYSTLRGVVTRHS